MEAFLKETIKKAGNIALGYFDKPLEKTIKTLSCDIVTQADIAVSEFLVHEIGAQYPDHTILSEEEDEAINPGGQYEWVMDPIDGTYCFAHGIPTWAVMIALMKDNEPYMNAVYFPVMDHLYFAEKGKGAWKNDKQIHVSNADTLDYSHCIMHRANLGNKYGTLFERFRAFEVNVVLNTKIIRSNLGSAASTCFFAEGSFDAAISNAGMVWDRLPLVLIAEEAGAIVTDSDGDPWKRDRQDIVMANKTLHPKIMELFKN